MKRKSKDLYPLGLVLSGGGARGFAHIGVFKVFEECGIKPDIIAGTSAGAIAGALFADGYTTEEIIRLFTKKDFSDFAKIKLPTDGLFDSNGFRRFLKKHLRAKTFEELQIPLVVVATDLDHGTIREFRSGPLIEPIVASSSVPIFFKPVLIDGIHYVDGGVLRNFPVSNIRDECEEIIGVNVNAYTPENYKQTIFSIAERSYHFMYRSNAIADRELCDLLIEALDMQRIKMFDLENISTIADIGYEAIVEALKERVVNKKIAKMSHQLLGAMDKEKKTQGRLSNNKLKKGG